MLRDRDRGLYQMDHDAVTEEFNPDVVEIFEKLGRKKIKLLTFDIVDVDEGTNGRFDVYIDFVTKENYFARFMAPDMTFEFMHDTVFALTRRQENKARKMVEDHLESTRDYWKTPR